MVEHIFHICQLSHMKWILSLILECPRQGSSACGSVKDTERNLLGDSFRKQHLLYYIWATTYIVEADRLWLDSTLLRTGRCVRPPGSLCESSSFRGDVEHADSSTGQLLATHTSSELSVLTKLSVPGSLAAGHGCIFSYRILENILEKTCHLWPVLSTTYLNDLFYYKT